MIYQQKLKGIMVAENRGCSLLSIGLSLGNMVAMTTTVSFVCFSTCTSSPIFPFSHGEIITFGRLLPDSSNDSVRVRCKLRRRLSSFL